MTKQLNLALAATVLLGATATACIYAFNQNYNIKREWSVVQAAELGGRELQRTVRIAFQNDKEFGPCIGILTVDRNARVWILAKASYGERLKILPRPDYEHRVRITSADFEEIRSKTELGDEVEQFLSNSIENNLP